jgi:predicted permease
MRSILLGAQVALSLVLLVGAALMTRSLQHAGSINPGFATNNVAVLSVDLRLHGYKDEQSASFWHELEERIAAAPGVRSVAHAFVVPLGSQRAMTGGSIDGKKTSGKTNIFSANWVSPGYLRTMQMPVIAGRDLKASDTKAMVINQAMAAKFWPDTNPLGHFVQIGNDRWEVVGVTKTVRSVVLSSPDEPYAYLVTDKGIDHHLIVRSDGDLRALPTMLPRLAASVDPRIRSTVSMLSENVKRHLDRQKDLAAIAGTLGTLALALACIGVYGVVAFAVQQRTREIGVRMALGATKSHVLSAVLMQNVRVVVIGAAIGLAAAAGVSRVITSYLYGLSPLDPISFGTVLAAMIASAIIASYLPARRAVTVDPSTALRHE